MTDAFELDPERRLWKPNRRSFFFGLGAALIAPMLPNLPEPLLKAATGWESVGLVVGDTFTIGGVFSINPKGFIKNDLEVFRVTSVTGTTIGIERAITSFPFGSMARVN